MRQFLKSGVPSDFRADHVKYILYNLLCSLNYVSKANVMHRDLKPANILLNDQCQVKICDFGLARTLPNSMVGQGSGNTRRVRSSAMASKLDTDALKSQISIKLLKEKEQRSKKKRCVSSHVSSRWFRAPEVILIENQYDQAVDMWSIGCILFELILRA